MSLRHAIYFSCDGCGTGYSEHRDTESSARTTATSAGWRLGTLDDFCPRCVAVREMNHRGLSPKDYARKRGYTKAADVIEVEQEATAMADLMSEAPQSERFPEEAPVELDAMGTLKRLGIL